MLPIQREYSMCACVCVCERVRVGGFSGVDCIQKDGSRRRQRPVRVHLVDVNDTVVFRILHTRRDITHNIIFVPHPRRPNPLLSI